jgi:hypothetical protein
MNSLSTTTIVDENLKPKRGRPVKPNTKDEKGRYICQLKWHKEKYEENPEKTIERCTKHQTKYRESFKILKEIVEQNDITLPSTIKEKIDKLMFVN